MKRQVIFLMTDTTRYDMLGCNGTPGIHTPHLDQLAAEGVCFDRAYSCQPVCGPARSAIFTGLFPHSNGSFANCLPLGANVKTVGQRLRDHHIHAAYIGKWHLDGGDYFGLGQCPDGWDADYWYDMKNYLDELSDEDKVRSRTPETSDAGIGADFTFGGRCTARALDFLQQHADEDFFLTVSYDEPHDPYVCPEPFASMYADYQFPKSPNVSDTLEGKPHYQKAWAGERLQMNREEIQLTPHRLLGCNSFADSLMGQILEQAQNLCPDAMIIYTSDHGDALQSHCLYAKGPAAYDEIAHIPLIIKGGAIGKRTSAPVSHIDLTPTILDYFDIPQPKWIEGKSLLPAVRDPEVCVNDAVFIEFTRYEVDHDGFGGYQPMRTVFDGRYKLSIHLLDSVDELYDLQQDPHELHNRINDPGLADIRNRLHDRLLDWMNDTRDPFRGYHWERRPWRTDARPASWDYTGYTRQRENEEYEPRQLDYMTGLPITEAVRPKARHKDASK